MSAEAPQLTGPDFAAGVALADLPEGKPLLGHAGGEAVMLVRRGDTVYAIGAKCTHYGGPLAEGLVVGDTIRCPWHHACFHLAHRRSDRRAGAQSRSPASRSSATATRARRRAAHAAAVAAAGRVAARRS